MDLKNAVAVCLISLFSATLVVLIARSLDSQAAAKLEPQLASLVEELEAIRKQGGIAAAPGAVATSDTAAEGLMVYYFHSKIRCPTCRSIETQTREIVQADFALQLGNGELAWKTLNYELPPVATLAKKFDLQMPVVVLARMKAGEVQDWKRLDNVWPLVGDKPAFAEYVRTSIQNMLASSPEPTLAVPSPDKTPTPQPDVPPVNSPVIPIPE